MKKILLATLAFLWLLTGLGGKLVAQENIAVWKFPYMQATSDPVSPSCVSDLIQDSDCELTVATDGWTYRATDYNNANTVLCDENDETKGLRLTNTNGNFTEASIVFKISAAPYGSIRLTYDHRISAIGGYETETWSYSTNGVSFTEQASITGATNTYSTEEVDFSSVSALNGASSVWFKLTVSGATVDNAVTAIDNVVFTGTSFTCKAPVNLATVSDDLPTMAVISWEPQGTNEESYTLVYSTTSLNNSVLNAYVTGGEDFVIQNATSPYPLNGLTAGTTYHIYVRANCDGDDNSLWAHTTVTTPAVCTVTQLAATNVEGTSATLSWQTSASNTLIRIFNAAKENPWNTTNGLVGSEQTVNGTSYEVTGLSTQTTYHVYAKSVCSENNISETAHTSFTTPCGAIGTLPWTEDFEDYSSGLPDCWIKVGSGTVAVQTSTVHNGTKSLKFSGASSNLVVLPDFSQGLNTLQLKIWTRPEGTSASPGSFDVGYITDLNDETTFTAVQTYQCTEFSDEYLQKTIYMNSFPDGSHLAFRHRPVYTYYYWFVDDIEVSEIPTCVAPTNIVVSNIEANTASVSWTDPLPATAWQYQLNNGEIIDVDAKPINLTGLTANTEYSIKVRSACGNDEYSDWSTETFTTSCESATALPYMQDFEGFAASTVPSCWDNSASTSSTLSSFPERIWGVYEYSNNKMLRMYNFYVQSGTALINSQPITLPSEGACLLSFDYSHLASCGAFNVKVSTDGGSSFTTLGTYSTTSTTYEYTNPGTFTTVEPISLAAYAGETIILQFFANANYGSGAIFVDNIVVRELSSAAEITAFSFAEDAEPAVIDSELAKITCLVSYSTESLTALEPTISISDYATIYPSSGVARDFSSPVTYTVTAEDETEKIWTVYVSKVTTASSAKDILSFTFTGQVGESVINPENHTVLAYAAWNYNFNNNITPTITVSPQATISPASGDAQNFANSVTYTVTAEDESTQEWTVTIENDPNACPNPTAIAINNLTSNAATLSWRQRYLEDEYNVKVSTTAMTDMTATANVFDGVVNTTSKELTGLTEYTTYYVYVQSVCENASGWVSNTFTTHCEAITVDADHIYTEGFESVTGSYAIPNCWERIASYTSGTAVYPYVYTDSYNYGYTHNGQKCLYMYTYSYSSAPENIIALSPMNDINTLQISFYAKAGSLPEAFEVGYMKNGEFTSVKSITLTTSYQNDPFVAYLSEAPADAENIAIRSYHSSSTSTVYVDDITVSPIPTCVAPENITVDVTTNSASVSWIDVLPTTEWQYQLDENAIATTSEKPINLTGLTSNTEYTIKVRSACTGDEYSDWSTVTFTTSCESVTVLPYMQDFESFDASTVPSCWDNSASTSTTISSNPGYIWGVYQYNNNKMLRMYNFYVQSGTALINSQPITLPSEGAYLLSFDYSHLANCEAFTLNISTDGGTSFSNLGTYSATSTTYNYTNPGSFTTAEPISLAAYAGETIILQFFANANYGSGAIFVDNIVIREMSSDNTIASYSASTAQGDAICNVSNEAHTISVVLRSGYVAGNAISQTIVPNEEHATIKQKVADNFVALPASFTWNMTAADTTVIYKVIAENGDEQLYEATISIESCAAPSALVAEQTSTTNVNLSWTPAEGTEAWNFYCSTTQLSASDLAALSEYTTLNATSTTYTVAGENTYYWYVRTDCDGSYSEWMSSSFTTWENCVAPTNVTTELVGDNDVLISWDVQDNLPVVETVINDSFERNDINGGEFNYTNSTGSLAWSIVSSEHHSGSKCLKSASGNHSSTSQISMAVNVTEASSFSFWYKVSSEYYYDDFSFAIDGTDVISDETGEVPWTQYSTTLSAGNHTLVWKFYKDSGDYDDVGYDCVWIDDITLPVSVPGGNSSVVVYKNDIELVTLPATTTSYTDEDVEAGNNCYKVKTICREGSESEFSDEACQEINNCLAVTNLSTSEITTTSAVVSWTRGSDETAWNITINGGSQAAINETSENVTVNENVISYALAGLEPMTTYTFAIQTDCGGTLGQLWQDIEFTTDRIPATLPYTCDFENATENNGWVLANGTQANKWYIGAASNNGGSNGLYITNDNGTTNAYNTSNTSYVYAYRTINVTANSEYVVSFDWKANGENGYDYYTYDYIPYDYMRAFLVPSSVTINAGTTNSISTTGAPTNWISVDGGNSLNLSNTWQSVSNIININEGSYNLVFYWINNYSGGTQPPASIDNVDIHEVSCPTVGNLAAAPSDITNNSAVIAWTERGLADEWEIIVSQSTLSDSQLASAETVTVTSTTSYSATNLDAETTYHVYVRANCDVDNNSRWAHATFTTVADCPNPDGLETSNVSATEVTITWNGYTASQWTLEYRIGTTGGWNDVEEIAATSYTLTTTANTTYNVRIKAVCGVGEESDYSSILSFTTPCEAITVDAEHPYTETFESVTGSYAIPDCWERIVEYTSYGSTYPYVYSYGAHNGQKCLYMYTYSSAPENLIALPPMNDLNTLRISLWAKASSTIPEAFEIGYISNGEFTSVQPITITTNYQQYEAYMNNVPANAERIAIRSYHGSSYVYVYVDDINVSIIPSCVEPTEMLVSNITPNTASVSWTDLYPATAWQYQLNNGEITDVDAKPIELNGLYSNTDYTIKVRTVCGIDEYSDWSTVTFTTSCEPITDLPYMQDFEGFAASTVPSCWDNSASTSTTISSNPDYIWGVYEYSNNKMLRMYNYYVQSGTALINSQPITLPSEGACLLSFDYSHLASCGEFNVKVSTDGGSSFTTLGTYSATSTSYNYTNPGSFTTAEPISLAAYAGETIILQFFANANYGSGAIFVDNIVIRELSSDNTILSYSATTAQGEAICNVNNEAHAISVILRSGYLRGSVISQTIVPNDANATVKQQIGSEFVELPESFAWEMTTADTTVIYKVIAENGDEQLYEANVTIESCAAPSTLVAEQTSTTNVNLSWTPAEGTDTWNFYCSTTQLSASDLAALSEYTTLDAASTTYTVVGENTYYWYVRTDCDGSYSEWMSGSFSTWENCIVPANLATSLVNNNDVVITWEVQGNLPIAETNIIDDFERSNIEDGPFTYTNDATYPWQMVASPSNNGTYCIKSSNSGVHNSQSTISMTYTTANDLTLSFRHWVMGEGDYTAYDYLIFTLDGVATNYSGTSSVNTGWTTVSHNLSAGTHTMTWTFRKDVSTNGPGDCAYIDDIRIYGSVPGGNSSVVLYKNDVELVTLHATETSYTDAGLETGHFCYTIKTVCREGNESEVSAPVCQDINNCFAVTNLSAGNINDNSAAISWTRGSDETAWNIIVNDGSPVAINETTEDLTVDGDEISYVLANLDPNTVYNVVIQTNCDGTLGQELPNVQFTTERIPISLPYTCDFEDANENSEWALNNGDQTNKWYIGTGANNGGANGLYISNTNGTSNSYNEESETYAYAYRFIKVEEEGNYEFSFDWMANGEEEWDFLRAFVVPASVATDFYAGESNGIEDGESNYVPTGWIDISETNGELSLEDTWQSSSKTVHLDAGRYNIVFFWENDDNSGDNPPAAIDNISIERARFTINASTVGYGSINPSGEITVDDGTTQVFTITPMDGFALSSFTVNGVERLSQVVNNTYTIESVNTDYTIVATFDAAIVITATAGNGGSISPEGQVSVGAHSNATFTITADNGYRILSVLVDDEEQMSDNTFRTTFSYTFENVTSDHRIAATFAEAPDHTITATVEGSGSVSPTSATVPYNGSQEFVFTANEGYRLSRVFVDGTSDVTTSVVNDTYTFTNVVDNHTIKGIFTANSYNLTIHYVYADNREAAPDHTESVVFGTEYSVESPVIPGYTADQLTVAGTMPAHEVTVTVTYTANTYTITVNVNGNGTVTYNGEPATTVTVNEGETPAFTITPAEGNRIASVMLDTNTEVDVDENGVYTFDAVMTNHTLDVTFEAIPVTYTITVNTGANGTVTYNGNEVTTVTVNEGETPAFVITPEENYQIDVLTVGGNVVELNQEQLAGFTYTFEPVTADITFSVTFTRLNAADMLEAGSMSVYPNPNNGMFSIDFSNIEGDATYQIINASGAVVETRDINVMNGETMNFNHDLRPGTYFVRIINGDKVYVEQIVVE